MPMKLVALIHVDENDTCEFNIPCGDGKKSFKWLAMVIAQRYAYAIGNGIPRNVYSSHGMSTSSLHYPQTLKLNNGSIPPVNGMLLDYVKDGDVIHAYLMNDLAIDHEGVPSYSMWATGQLQDHYDESKNNNNSRSKSSFKSDTQRKDVVGSTSSLMINDIPYDLKANAKFMRLVLRSQMIDEEKATSFLNESWRIVERNIPNLLISKKLSASTRTSFTSTSSTSNSEKLRNLCSEYIYILYEFYQKFTNSETSEFTCESLVNFMEEMNIFAHRETIKLSKKLFRKIISRHENTQHDDDDYNSHEKSNLSFGEFLATLVYASQLRHNDTLDDTSCINDCTGAFQHLLYCNIEEAAIRYNLQCLIRRIFCRENLLYKMRKFHDPILSLFEKYANKNDRDITLTIPFENVMEILVNCRLLEAGDKSTLKMLISKCKSNEIIGRKSVHKIVMQLPEDEYTFAEVFEICARAGISTFLHNQNQQHQQQRVQESPSQQKQHQNQQNRRRPVESGEWNGDDSGDEDDVRGGIMKQHSNDDGNDGGGNGSENYENDVANAMLKGLKAVAAYQIEHS